MSSGNSAKVSRLHHSMTCVIGRLFLHGSMLGVSKECLVSVGLEVQIYLGGLAPLAPLSSD